MEILYHSSGYKHDELKPGFLHTGKLVKWDQTESNEWLYATTDSEEAISQGFASILDKKFNLSRYQSNKKQITLTFDNKLPTRKEINELVIFLYTIEKDNNIWERVNNAYNGIDNEYKTKEVITSKYIISCQELKISDWLKDKIVFIKKKSKPINW